jgi:putative Mg2+ transporter-C (MgtC) family protein
MFSNLHVIGGATDVVLRLGTATLIGAALGLDREVRGKPAGMRTHALVALGASLVTVTSISLCFTGTVLDGGSVTRAIQGIIAGVGFLGGGAILKTTDEGVHGLTTAASIWVVASLGIACGAGEWPSALVGLGLALIVLVFGSALEGAINRAMPNRLKRRAAERTPPPPNAS